MLYSFLFSFFLFFFSSGISEDNDVTSIPQDAETTDSGIRYQVLREGSGEHPIATSLVTVHYNGWTMDGALFDSSYQRGQTITFSLQQVIQGWTEGVQLMQKGSTMRMWIPEDLAYKGQAGSPQGMLVFDIELIDFVNPPTAPTPLLPPQNVSKTTTGKPFLIQSIPPAEGTPSSSSQVTLHYNIWSTAGELAQSTLLSKMPLTIAMNDLQPEWQEVLLKMTANDRVLLWYFPEETSLQSYQSSPPILYELLLLEVH